MFSKILTKLVDQAIVPALLLFAARIVSVLLLSRYFGTALSVDASGFLFSSAEDYLLINSYSISFILVLLCVGLLYILLKSYIFHDSHISPATTVKAFAWRVSYLIQTSFDLYAQAVVWLLYLYLFTVVSAIMAYFGYLYLWVLYSALILTVLSTLLFVFDLERELAGYVTKEPFAEDTPDHLVDDYVLSFKGR